ncbi:peptide chain release factor N(5)-glutamine methyltransferase [Allopontixanthobacter sp.]|uniref:peptide chain release factor N(5)-glutamine methyltransferase n=1 Tax=Allopontixanthobacter sp. TaxID=2906452 RepID=UPI002ABA311B|nr:peptide chain release factor N(5)-glutamine methyltransferase [Allopontixanthobacter sp.]MDZ4307139.1 peptide chain release factor N(5)-glutamine methyltransferase [Allopontixanthobacter sp.]
MAETVAAAIRAAAERLSRTSDTARLDAELLMAEALGVSRSELLLRHSGDAVPPSFADLIRRRAGHEPIAHILGHQDFFGRSFIVTRDVLIPRGDSEILIEAALGMVQGPGRVLDCGTGSGALLLTMLAERSELKGVGIDNSPRALEVAGANAARLGLAERARLLDRDWRAAGWSGDLGQFALVIANPPYVESGADLAPSVRDFEPAAALFAGEDGLDDYRILIPQLRDLLVPGGSAIFEIGAQQADQVTGLARANGFDVTLCRDIAHRPRALVLQ